jgi:hypothetical protein
MDNIKYYHMLQYKDNGKIANTVIGYYLIDNNEQLWNETLEELYGILKDLHYQFVWNLDGIPFLNHVLLPLTLNDLRIYLSCIDCRLNILSNLQRKSEFTCKH